jgi:hypothetical protein
MLTRDSRESKQGVEFVLGDLASGEGLHAAVKHLRSSCTLPAPPWGDDVKARHVVEAATRGTPADAGWSSRYGSSAGPPDLSEPGRIWPRTGLWATAPGSSSWLGGWAHQPLSGLAEVLSVSVGEPG